jgi:hypothetical protein
MYKPNIKAYVKSLDWSHSAAGMRLSLMFRNSHKIHKFVFCEETNVVFASLHKLVINAEMCRGCFRKHYLYCEHNQSCPLFQVNMADFCLKLTSIIIILYF